MPFSNTWNKRNILDTQQPFLRMEYKKISWTSATSALSLGVHGLQDTTQATKAICYSSFWTHSWCGAPVFVSRVRTKNMKMTKTARPTQNPITMESGEKEKIIWSAFHLHLQKVPFHIQYETTDPQKLCILFLVGKMGRMIRFIFIFEWKADTEPLVSSPNFIHIQTNQKQAESGKGLNSLLLN